jgi:transcription antitermination factor NusG
MAASWYALRSKPNKEDVAWQQVKARGFDTFYPRLKTRTTHSRAKQIRPYFPGYLFVRADLEAVGSSIFHYMPFTSGLVSFGGEPAPVPEALIRSIHRRAEEVEAAEDHAFDGLKSGDAVSIQAGPLAGYEAVFDARLSGGERVRVLLEILGERRIPVELSAAQIEPKKRA